MMPPALLSLSRLRHRRSPLLLSIPDADLQLPSSATAHPSPTNPPQEYAVLVKRLIFLPSLCPEIVVQDARLEDCWEVADTHCSSFFPDYTFPLNLVLRIDHYIALLSGFLVPPGCMRTSLVAVNTSVNNSISIECGDLRDAEFQGKYGLSKGSIAGILTIDTVADYLPRRGPLKQRRTGIAYIANVAVRKEERQKGIAKMLVAEAEAHARSWGCLSSWQVTSSLELNNQRKI